MKKLILTVMIIIAAAMAVPVRVKAADKIDWMKLFKENRELFYKIGTCTDEESVEEGLYSDYTGIDPLKEAAVTKGASKETKEKYKNAKKIKENKGKSSYGGASSGSSYGMDGKGYVYGTDELHVAGRPSDHETGYTKAGYYGEIGYYSGSNSNQYNTGSGRGYVYGNDELHVTGCPADPVTGYTLPGFYGDVD